MRTFFDLVQGYAPSLLKSFHKAEMIAQLTNGTNVLFRSSDDPDRLRGPNIGWFYLDEAALMDADVWPIMIGRLREQPGRAWATSTPRGFNWMHEVFVKYDSADYAVIRSSTRDNVFLPDGFLRSLEQSYDTEWTAQEIEGEFLDLGAIDHFLPSVALWDACYDDALSPLDKHTPCVLAMDAGESNDTFATVIVSKHPGDPDRLAVRYVRAYVPSKGVPLDFDAIEADIRALVSSYAIQQIAYDPFLLGQMIRRLTSGGAPISAPAEPFHQGADRLEADKALYDLITQRRIAHSGDPDLRQHLANANRKVDAESRKLRIVKRTYSQKIDLAVALAMACHRAGEIGPPATGFSFSYDQRRK